MQEVSLTFSWRDHTSSYSFSELKGSRVAKGPWQQLLPVFEFSRREKQNNSAVQSGADKTKQAPPLCRQMANSLLLSSASGPPKTQIQIHTHTHDTPLKALDPNLRHHPFPNPPTRHARFSFLLLLLSRASLCDALYLYQQILNIKPIHRKDSYIYLYPLK